MLKLSRGATRASWAGWRSTQHVLVGNLHPSLNQVGLVGLPGLT